MSRTVIAFIVLSLLGLIVIQVGMLRIGLIKESESYKSEVSAVMLDVSTKLFEDTKLSEQIATLSKEADVDKRTIFNTCLLYTSPSPRDATLSRMPSSA